jgi:hypothetical protein
VRKASAALLASGDWRHYRLDLVVKWDILGNFVADEICVLSSCIPHGMDQLKMVDAHISNINDSEYQINHKPTMVTKFS